MPEEKPMKRCAAKHLASELRKAGFSETASNHPSEFLILQNARIDRPVNQ
jgi:hypothetical protein